MIRTALPIIGLLLLILQIGALSIYAQDYTQWELPDGAIARIGKGRINDMAYSPDGSILAVATTIGIWVYDTDTYQERKLLSRSHQEMEKVYFTDNGTVLAGMERFTDKITQWDVTLLEIEKPSKKKHDFPRSATYSLDGNTYATISFNKIHIRDAKTNTSKHILKGHESMVTCLSYSPNSKIIASGSRDQTVRLWDVNTGKLIRTLTEHKSEIIFLSFSPDGSTLITGSSDMTINYWDVTSRELKLPLAMQGVISDKRDSKEKIKRTFFSPDKSILVTAGEYRTIHLWDTTTGKLKHTFTDPEKNIKKDGYVKEVENILFSPNGKSILSLVNDKQIRMWDIATGKRMPFTGNTGYLTNATFSPDGKTLATVDYPGEIRIWDIATGKLKRTISNLSPRDNRNYQDDRNYMAFAGNGEKFITTESDGSIYLWDTITKRLHTLLRKKDNSKNAWTSKIQVSPDGETIVSWNASKDRLIRLWNATTGEPKRRIKDHKGPIKRVVFSMDSSILASWSSSYEDNRIRLWNVATGRHSHTFTGHKNLIECVTFSPDGNTLISGGQDGTILIWDVRTGKHKKTLIDQQVDTEHNTHSNSIKVLMFNSDGRILATGDKKGIIHLWDVSKWQISKTLKGHADAISNISFAPDSRSIASTAKDGTVRLWDIDTGQQIQSITGDKPMQWYVMFYPNGLSLATEVAGMSPRYDTEIINLWDLRTGERIKTLSGHSWKITGISFSPDGNKLASISNMDNTVLLWDLSSIIQEFDVK
ncbi:hypothetical protein C6497_09985 [Candidatus Poribacteria bacterium]|nr:MAG: hypothetical protein C6497_09985 [Candidatus Poribacteria bacterium]